MTGSSPKYIGVELLHPPRQTIPAATRRFKQEHQPPLGRQSTSDPNVAPMPPRTSLVKKKKKKFHQGERPTPRRGKSSQQARVPDATRTTGNSPTNQERPPATPTDYLLAKNNKIKEHKKRKITKEKTRTGIPYSFIDTRRCLSAGVYPKVQKSERKVQSLNPKMSYGPRRGRTKS